MRKEYESLRQYLGEYADQSPKEGDEPAGEVESFTVPGDLSDLAVEELVELHGKAVEVFDQSYADGAATEELAPLVKTIEGLTTEIHEREKALAAEEAAKAELAAKIDGFRETFATEEEAVEEVEVVEEGAEDVAADVPAEDTVEVVDIGEEVAKAKDVTLSLRKVERLNQTPKPKTEVRDRVRETIISTGSKTGFNVGEGMSWDDLGAAVNKRLAGYNHAQYMTASQGGRHISQQEGVASFKKPFSADLIVDTDSPSDLDAVIARAVDQKRLKGGSLVASGGWGAPSETLYDFLELETREGMFSLPEVGVRRGGVRFTQGPDFASLYSKYVGFNYTEKQDEDGLYKWDEQNEKFVEGSKPVYDLTMPTFQDVRLDTAGLAIKAGLLGMRGYPEAIARIIRGAMIAHDHHMNANLIDKVEDLSTAVTMNEGIGATAPLLTAIELQAEHYRTAHRLGFNHQLEGVFPNWVRGVIRTDLAQRAGVDLIDVPDARILEWFRNRYIYPQFVYDWQSLDTTAAASLKAWPSSIKFLLYAAGTFVRGSSEVITLDTLYDSVLLGKNDFTALFTEEGWLVLKRGHDSRAITVPVTPDGATASTVVVNIEDQG